LTGGRNDAVDRVVIAHGTTTAFTPLCLNYCSRYWACSALALQRDTASENLSPDEGRDNTGGVDRYCPYLIPGVLVAIDSNIRNGGR